MPLKIVSQYTLDFSEVKGQENAKRAGVSEFIKTEEKDARKIITQCEAGSIITNPPYGERLSDIEESKRLYKALNPSFSKLPKWSYYILTSHEEFEKEFGKRADRRRKIYNGMLKTYLYQFMGPKPPKQNK